MAAALRLLLLVLVLAYSLVLGPSSVLAARTAASRHKVLRLRIFRPQAAKA